MPIMTGGKVSVNIDFNPTRLYKLLNAYKWAEAAEYVNKEPIEASIWLTGGREESELPIHFIASNWEKGDNVGTKDVIACIESLVRGYPDGASFPNHTGNCPLHLAIHSHAPIKLLSVLVVACPDILWKEGARGKNVMEMLPTVYQTDLVSGMMSAMNLIEKQEETDVVSEMMMSVSLDCKDFKRKNYELENNVAALKTMLEETRQELVETKVERNELRERTLDLESSLKIKDKKLQSNKLSLSSDSDDKYRDNDKDMKNLFGRTLEYRKMCQTIGAIEGSMKNVMKDFEGLWVLQNSSKVDHDYNEDLDQVDETDTTIGLKIESLKDVFTNFTKSIALKKEETVPIIAESEHKSILQNQGEKFVTEIEGLKNNFQMEEEYFDTVEKTLITARNEAQKELKYVSDKYEIASGRLAELEEEKRKRGTYENLDKLFSNVQAEHSALHQELSKKKILETEISMWKDKFFAIEEQRANAEQNMLDALEAADKRWFKDDHFKKENTRLKRTLQDLNAKVKEQDKAMFDYERESAELQLHKDSCDLLLAEWRKMTDLVEVKDERIAMLEEQMSPRRISPRVIEGRDETSSPEMKVTERRDAKVSLRSTARFRAKGGVSSN